VCVLIAAYWQAAKHGYPRAPTVTAPASASPAGARWRKTFLGALPGLMVIAIILVCVDEGHCDGHRSGRYRGDLFAGADGRRVSHDDAKKLFKSLSKASKTTGVMLLLIGVSNMLRYQMAYLEIPDAIEHMLDGAPASSPWLMLLYINIIQIFLGTFVDMAAHILITTPLFLPMAMQRRRARAVRDHDAAELRAGSGAPADRLGAVHRLRDRQDIHRGGDEDRLALLSGDLHRHHPGDLRAGLLHMAAHDADRPQGAVSKKESPR
jgi:hypothetical protein